MNLQKTMSQFIKDTEISEKYLKDDNLQNKTKFQKYKVWVTRYRKVNASKFFNTDIHKIQKPKLIKDH